MRHKTSFNRWNLNISKKLATNLTFKCLKLSTTGTLWLFKESETSLCFEIANNRTLCFLVLKQKSQVRLEKWFKFNILVKVCILQDLDEELEWFEVRIRIISIVKRRRYMSTTTQLLVTTRICYWTVPYKWHYFSLSTLPCPKSFDVSRDLLHEYGTVFVFGVVLAYSTWFRH